MRIVQMPIWDVRFTVVSKAHEHRCWRFNVRVAAGNSADAKTIALERDDVTRIYGDKVFSRIEFIKKLPEVTLIDADNVGEEK